MPDGNMRRSLPRPFSAHECLRSGAKDEGKNCEISVNWQRLLDIRRDGCYNEHRKCYRNVTKRFRNTNQKAK